MHLHLESEVLRIEAERSVNIIDDIADRDHVLQLVLLPWGHAGPAPGSLLARLPSPPCSSRCTSGSAIPRCWSVASGPDRSVKGDRFKKALQAGASLAFIGTMVVPSLDRGLVLGTRGRAVAGNLLVALGFWADLPGYAEHAQHVKYRLVPGLW